MILQLKPIARLSYISSDFPKSSITLFNAFEELNMIDARISELPHAINRLRSPILKYGPWQSALAERSSSDSVLGPQHLKCHSIVAPSSQRSSSCFFQRFFATADRPCRACELTSSSSATDWRKIPCPLNKPLNDRSPLFHRYSPAMRSQKSALENTHKLRVKAFLNCQSPAFPVIHVDLRRIAHPLPSAELLDLAAVLLLSAKRGGQREPFGGALSSIDFESIPNP